MQIYEIKKYIGSYTAAMDGVDAIVFTGGIGENADDMRATVCDGLTFLGIKIDKEFNKTLVKGKEGENFHTRLKGSRFRSSDKTRSLL